MSATDEPFGPSPFTRFSRAVWRELIRLDPDGGVQWPAIRVGISVAVPMSLVYGTGHGAWAPFAMFGALGAVYGKHLEYRARLWQQIGSGLALTIAVTAGTGIGVAAPASLLAVLGMTVLSAVGLLLTRTLGWLPVPSLFLVFAFGTVSSYQQPAIDLIAAPIVAAASATLAVLLGQAGRLRGSAGRPRREGPARVSLARILAAPGTTTDLLCYTLGPWSPARPRTSRASAIPTGPRCPRPSRSPAPISPHSSVARHFAWPAPWSAWASRSPCCRPDHRSGCSS